ncbi:MAG: PEGA domain-containing protein [Planctomycetaceae bacterium]|nr:PEGA domain-containing protein [Planctomycetaceae bacterium]
MLRHTMVLMIVAAALTAGCVERQITFTSDPPGAIVIVSEKEVGRTPVTIPFTWYGDYEILYKLKDYKTVRTHAQINMPWYEVPPIDLMSELAPWTYHDFRYFHQILVKAESPSDEELIQRAVIMEKRVLEPEKH